MSNEQDRTIELSERENLGSQLGVADNTICERDAEGHCITCSDEALPARVLSVDQQLGIACVSITDAVEEVDVTLIDDVVPGDLLLVHGGVAIGNADEHVSRDMREVRP